MTGLELLKAPATTAVEIADIISAPCPPVVPTECDRLSCRECWLAWLTTGEAKTEEGPSDERTAPVDGPGYYRPPVEANREAAAKVKAGNLEYTATAFTRQYDSGGHQQP